MIRNIYSLTTEYGDLHVGECTSSNKGNARNYVCKVFYAMRGRNREIMRNIIVYIPNEVFEGVAVYPVVMRISKHDGNSITQNKFIKVAGIRYLGQMETRESREQAEIDWYKQGWKSSWQNVMDELVPQGQPRDIQKWRRNRRGEWVRIETLPDRPRVVRSASSSSPPVSTASTSIPQAPPLVSASSASSSLPSSSESPHYLESMAERDRESKRSYPEGYEVKNPAVYELTESRKSRDYRKKRDSMIEKAEREAMERRRAREIEKRKAERDRILRERQERKEIKERLEKAERKLREERDKNNRSRKSKEENDREESERRRREYEERERRKREELEKAEREHRRQEKLLGREHKEFDVSKSSSEPVEYDYKHNDAVNETGSGEYLDVRRQEAPIRREERVREHERKQKRNTAYEQAYKEEYSQAYKEAYAKARANVAHKTQVDRFLDEDRPVRPARKRVGIEEPKRRWWQR